MKIVMWKLLWLLFSSCCLRFVVASLAFCNDWNYLEVKEDRDDNTFTCSGFTSQQRVTLMLDDDIFLITCPPVPPSCTGMVFGYFNVSRTLSTSIDITIMPTKALGGIGKHLSCNDRTCQLDLIYPAENSTCYIMFGGEMGKVTGWCNVPKLKSTKFLNNSGCYFYRTSQAGDKPATTGFYQMSLKPSAQAGYYTGTCNMTTDLPSEGRYSYTVFIMPGEVHVSAMFTGSNEIRRPAASLTHTCPQFVTEGYDVNCKCSANDLGSPPGLLTWNITGSSQLSLTDLRREQHGVNYVCSLTWNKTVQQSLTYTLTVNYSPTNIIFKMNSSVSSTVTVVENTTVTLLCQSDGRPEPNLTITDVTNRVLESVQGGNGTLAELSHTITIIQCEASGDYRCTAENSVGRTSRSVRLYVKCKPRNSFTDVCFVPLTLSEGHNTSFQFIAYPTHVNVTKYFCGSNISNCETLASDEVFRVNCSSSSQFIYKVTCTVTVMEVTSYTAGLYKAVVSNDLGGVPLIFEALFRNTTESEKCKDLISAEYSQGQTAGLGIGMGVAAAEALLFATFVFVSFWRRRRQTSNVKGVRGNTAYISPQDILSDKTTEVDSRRTSSEHYQNDIKKECKYEAIGNSETGQTAAYTNVEGSKLPSRKISNKTGNVYDGLRLQDVGVRSPYAGLP